MYLTTSGETIDNFMQVKNEYEASLKARQEHIKKLSGEVKSIKKLRV